MRAAAISSATAGRDVLFRNQSGTLAYWAVSGTDDLQAPYTLANPGGKWSVVGLGDFNGDGIHGHSVRGRRRRSRRYG